MRMEKYFLIIVFVILSFSCNDYISSDYPIKTRNVASRGSTHIKLHYSHEDSAEAATIAVWYSGKIRASDSLISEVLFSLNYIRYLFDDKVPHYDSLSVLQAWRFIPPWVISELGIEFDDSTTVKLNQGTYNAWNEFDIYLRPKHYEVVYGWTMLHFDGYLHPVRLAELYRTLPGVIYAEAEWAIFPDFEIFPIYPRFDGKNWSYLFTSIGRFVPIWYFRYERGKPSYMGSYDGNGPPPIWLVDALKNRDDFYKWDGPPK